jgi:hypothetical protein
METLLVCPEEEAPYFRLVSHEVSFSQEFFFCPLFFRQTDMNQTGGIDPDMFWDNISP